MAQAASSNPRFVTTRWSMVVLAGGMRTTTLAERALAELCEVYWLPVYSFIRRQQHGPESAEDLTQAFFAHLLSRTFLRNVRAERGRFRSWLLAALRHFLSNEREHVQARKRGGGQRIVSLDQQRGEQGFRQVAGHDETADVLFERQWAFTLLDTVLSQLKEELQESPQLFDVLGGSLTSDRDSFCYADAAARLGITVAAARTAAHRLRKRYRRLLRAEIRETVATEDDVDDEIQRLFRAVARTV